MIAITPAEHNTFSVSENEYEYASFKINTDKGGAFISLTFNEQYFQSNESQRKAVNLAIEQKVKSLNNSQKKLFFISNNHTSVADYFSPLDQYITLYKVISKVEAFVHDDFSIKSIDKENIPLSIQSFFENCFIDDYPFDFEEYIHMIKEKPYHFFQLENNGETAAALLGYAVNSTTFYLTLIAVAAQYRNNGLASTLLKHLETLTMGHTIYLGMYASNAEAMRLYAKNGYVEKKVRYIICKQIV
jgi:ribosomal protein S18 acetylase RimI-like enzyme